MGRSDPWSKNWWVIFKNGGPKHIKLTTVDIRVVYFTYKQTLVCIFVYGLLINNYTVKPVLSGHSKNKTNYRLMQSKVLQNARRGAFCNTLDLHLATICYLDLCFVFFEWLLKTCFTVLTTCTTYMYILFCGVRRFTVRFCLFV